MAPTSRACPPVDPCARRRRARTRGARPPRGRPPAPPAAAPAGRSGRRGPAAAGARCGCPRGDRIAQLVLQRVERAVFRPVDALPESARGAGGRTGPPAGTPGWSAPSTARGGVMALGRRGRKSERAKLDATPPWATEKVRDTDLTTGPYDEADSPDDELERLDLGALRIPVVSGVEVRVDVNPDGQVIAATLSYGGSEAQVGAFAAPRTAGIWDEIRAEIRGSIIEPGRHRRRRARAGSAPSWSAGCRCRAVTSRCGSSGWTGRGGSCGRCSPGGGDRPGPRRGAGGRGPQHRGGPRQLADAGARPAAAGAAQGGRRAGRAGRRRAPGAEPDEDDLAEEPEELATRSRRAGARPEPEPDRPGRAAAAAPTAAAAENRRSRLGLPARTPD